MGVNLVKYDAARKALAQAHRVDEAKSIRDKALAMRAYAQHAKDTEPINYATDIRLRAERRAGELLGEMAANGQRQKRGDADDCRRKPSVPTLSDLGVTKIQSHRWQKLAELDDEEFEEKVEKAKRNHVSTLESRKSSLK